ncbi:hypothetical protein [Rhizobium oryzicola]|uniref:Uncharacterized protein n=1 Tax=Rhizobium oryzicola TaxID=1232668 RepID=A0ABT8SWG4_9HYPH|nr:hypothetical protein [Rhizobium oryzicola]MDO1582676.1 hypothetical protein [Rhizobium oryzicola]
MAPLLDWIEMPIMQFKADGAYDGSSTHDAVTNFGPAAAVAMLPRANALGSDHPGQRYRVITAITADSRMK